MLSSVRCKAQTHYGAGIRLKHVAEQENGMESFIPHTLAMHFKDVKFYSCL